MTIMIPNRDGDTVAQRIVPIATGNVNIISIMGTTEGVVTALVYEDNAGQVGNLITSVELTSNAGYLSVVGSGGGWSGFSVLSGVPVWLALTSGGRDSTYLETTTFYPPISQLIYDGGSWILPSTEEPIMMQILAGTSNGGGGYNVTSTYYDTITVAVTTIDSTNNVVSGSKTWGTQAAGLALTVNSFVESGGALTLDVAEVSSINFGGNSIRVAVGGSLTLGGKTISPVADTLYEILGS